MAADDRQGNRPRYRYVGLAALILIVAAALMAGLWQVGRLVTRDAPAGPQPPATTGLPAPAPATTPTPAPVDETTITSLAAHADDAAGTITFRLAAEVAPEERIAEVLLWYDTEAGQEVTRFGGPFSWRTAITYRLDATQEGLTRTLTTTTGLDYWWLVRDTGGEVARTGGRVALGPRLQTLVTPPTPEPPPVDFRWSVSETERLAFYYVPETAAARDRHEIGALAEESLDLIRSTLDMEFQGQMDIYLVPRVFWQGGAAYGDKVQLISYLDRNYTAVEIWSYFTHEGTHALAQDLIQPKQNGGGPDGVLVEGLAVWASSGHYRREPIDTWAAAIVQTNTYIPLAKLRAGPFYDFQHETAYLEAASFVQYLIDNHGLETLKNLYGQATGDAGHDEILVHTLYGKGYAELEAEWLAYLQSLEPTPKQVETWQFKVRSFDLMRRYQTELDPDARILPSSPPPDWTSDTVRIFTRRRDEPINLILETALIEAQEELYGGDVREATTLLDDVEAALNADGTPAAPSLQAREAILDLLAAQDRAILRADAGAYRATLAPGSPLAGDEAVEALLERPFVAYRQELVSLDLAEDGQSARGMVLLHAELAGEDGAEQNPPLQAVTLVRAGGGWLLSGREEATVDLELPIAGD